MDCRQVVNKFFALVATVGFALPIYAGIPLKTQFSAKFVDASGEPIVGTISIRLDLVPSSYPTCLLYREIQSYTVAADGLINIQLGAGTTTVGSFATSLFMNESSLTCLTSAGATAGTQAVASSESRKLYVYIDGEAYGSVEMVSVPYAIKAAKADMAISVQAQAVSNLSLAGITTNCTSGQTITFDGSGNFACHSLTSVDTTTLGTGSVSNAEFGTLDGVSTPIQTQFTNVAATAAAVSATVTTIGTTVTSISGAVLYATATANGITITKTGNYIDASINALGVTSGMIASGIVATKIGAGSVDNAEFGYLDGVSGPIQTQIDTVSTPTFTGLVRSIAGPSAVATITDNIVKITGSAAATLDLPDATLVPGRHITVINALTSSYIVTLTSTNSAVTTASPDVANSKAAIAVSDGTSWYIIGI